MLAVAKAAWQFWVKLPDQNIIEKIFKGEMLIRTLSKTLHQIFGKITLNFQLLGKIINDSDDNFKRNSKHVVMD